MKRQTLHFPFCQDLGNKKVLDIIWPEKINFALFKIKQRMNLGGGRTIPDTDIDIPGFYEVQKVNLGFWSSLTESEYQTFIAPSDYNTSELFYVREKQIKIDIPAEFLQIWKDQPHLIEHATFQFYFLNENLFSANLPFLRINDNYQIEVDWKIRSSPSGTFLFFRSGHIFFKWKIEVRQGMINLSIVKETVKVMMETGKKLGSLVAKFLSLGTINLDGKETEAVEKMAGNILTGKDNWEKMGLSKERTGKIQEQHTERLFKSTYSDLVSNTIEPSIFYSNTINFPYNLFDYWLRNEKDPFFVRIYWSNNLLNNLIHNNNENPITYPLNITFKSLANILRKGYWQGRLKLDYDPGGFMADKFAKGVTFFEDKEKDFTDPKLGIKELADRVKYSATGGDNYLAEEIKEFENWTLPVNRPKGSNYHQRGHYFIFYEDGSTEHWMALYPLASSCNFNQTLADGHTRQAFMLEFDKPVKKIVDIYTCIGCGAQNTPLFETLHSNYRNNNSDSLETIHKGLPFEPWFTEMSKAVASEYHLTVDGAAGRLGGKGDVWEKATQEIPDKTFNRAYGFIPDGSTITWRLSGESSRVRIQKVPSHNDFDNLDWTPPIGSGGEIEIPLTEPDLTGLDPSAPDFVPETDFPTPDLDPTRGEPEITPLEPDITGDPDIPTDPEFPEPEIPEPAVPEPEPSPTDPDTTPDTGERDPGDGERPEDFD
ncbi:MAG: hypothetical protein LBR43_01330 [Spiroplasmataceae bacterium]|jgi:hypothetical protein|nr:hypothetical protein [Spiroplasmataceae bacterium]